MEELRMRITLIIALFAPPLMTITIALKSRSRLCVIFKALTTVCISLMALLNAEGSEWFIFVGSIFSLAGDIFLEFERRFLHGMFAFFLTHVFYSISFVKLSNLPSGWVFAVIYSIALLQYFFLKKNLGRFKLPVLLYSLAIAMMLSLSFAAIRGEDYSRVLLPIGATLFAFSDSYITWDKFVKKLPLRNFLVLFTYFTGQLLIALSIVI